MFELIKAHQLNIMIGLSSVCFAVGLFALFTKSLVKRRRIIIADMEFSASILLFADRLAYIYRGDTSLTGFYMVRITNFLVFFMTISVIHSFNMYLTDFCRNDLNLEKLPVRLRAVEIITGIGWFLIIVSQFTGLYYYFDETNTYQRGNGFIICYIIPLVALVVQLSVIIQYARRLSRYIVIPMIFFTVVPMLASLLQALFYGVSLTNMTIVGMCIILYVFAIKETNDKIEKAQQKQLEEIDNIRKKLLKSYEQTMVAFARAVDSKNRYTKGHSLRVADYSREIAQTLGMDERGCLSVYYSAVLHDIGKMEMSDSIIDKTGRLSDAEEEAYRKHTLTGGEILSEVEELPFLKTAALYHHERYDGKGYPEGKKGEDIPIIARIVAVANAYDEMTSERDTHQPFAQSKVREALISGSGTLYDPKIVNIMVDMIDRDTEYTMRELDDEGIEEAEKNDITVVKRMHFDDYKDVVSDGIRISKEFLKIRFETRPDAGFDRKTSIPALILFDSFDRCVHRNERGIRNFRYFEFSEIWLDGHAVGTAARSIKTDVHEKKSSDNIDDNEWIAYEIEAVSVGDHVRVKINSRYISVNVTVALPDASRYVFLGVAGEHCTIKSIAVNEIPLGSEEAGITRIAPEVNYFTRKDGDIPNIEINDYREKTSVGIPIEDDMRIYFHTKSLPVANLVNHCAYVLIFSSDDGTVTGKNYIEYACIRLDGEDATDSKAADNNLVVTKNDAFEGWDLWKAIYKKGLDYEVRFKRKKNRITFNTENAGISIECNTVVPNDTNNIYVAFTGNLCALMNIRIR